MLAMRLTGIVSAPSSRSITKRSGLLSTQHTRFVACTPELRCTCRQGVWHANIKRPAIVSTAGDYEQQLDIWQRSNR